MIEFEVTASDSRSQFCVKVYASYQSLASLVADLGCFRAEVYGGIYDIEFGKFGPEYASGAFQARLHFDMDGRGQLFITVRAESDWYTFSRTHVADRVTLHLRSEPGLLDNFIEELRQVDAGTRNKATLECV